MKKSFMIMTLTVALCSSYSIAKQGNGGAQGKDVGGFRHSQQTEWRSHQELQKSENREFRKSLEGLSGEERAAAISTRNLLQQRENRIFRQKLHDENMFYLKSRLVDNKNLTDARKAELIAFYEQQFQENIAFRDAQNAELVAFFENTANDAALTLEQKKEALRQFVRTQKDAAIEQHQTQNTELKQEMDSLRPASDTPDTEDDEDEGADTGSTQQ